jgi:hypothetical protein
VTAMVMSVHRKTLGGERVCDVVVSAEVLAHAMNKHDDAHGHLAPVSGPAIADEVPTVGGTVAKRVGLHHRVPLTRVHRETGWGTMTITVITLEWSDRNGQVPTRQYSADWPPQT